MHKSITVQNNGYLNKMAKEVSEDSSAEDVCSWLLGCKPEFEKYFISARENDVNGATLLFAPMDDLLGTLGISSVGHRHLLRKEITALRARVPPQSEEEEDEEHGIPDARDEVC